MSFIQIHTQKHTHTHTLDIQTAQPNILHARLQALNLAALNPKLSTLTVAPNPKPQTPKAPNPETSEPKLNPKVTESAKSDTGTGGLGFRWFGSLRFRGLGTECRDPTPTRILRNPEIFW